jgi:hypothetical protein
VFSLGGWDQAAVGWKRPLDISWAIISLVRNAAAVMMSRFPAYFGR